MLDKLRKYWPLVPAHRKVLLFAIAFIGVMCAVTSFFAAMSAYRSESTMPKYAYLVPWLFSAMFAAWIADAFSHIAFKETITGAERLVHDMLLYGANFPSWFSYVMSIWLGDIMFPLSITFVLLKIGYACYDEFKFHWVRANRSETIVHYVLFLSVFALDVIWLRWAYMDHWMGLLALF